jgi:hypothetical protein
MELANLVADHSFISPGETDIEPILTAPPGSIAPAPF